VAVEVRLDDELHGRGELVGFAAGVVEIWELEVCCSALGVKSATAARATSSRAKRMLESVKIVCVFFPSKAALLRYPAAHLRSQP